jgi:hypothetical protein
MERAPLPPKDVLWRKGEAPLLIAVSGGSVPPKILKVEVACHRRRKPRLGRRQSSLQISGRRAVPVRHEDKSIPRMLGKLVHHEARCWACWAFWAAGGWARVKTRVWSWRCSMAQKPPPSPGVCSCHRASSRGWLGWERRFWSGRNESWAFGWLRCCLGRLLPGGLPVSGNLHP